jgi:hypothetical protein
VDTEGARALAARIAAGKPEEDGGPKAAPPSVPEEPRASTVQIFYIRPEKVRREVRVYVRGRDGALERQP